MRARGSVGGQATAATSPKKARALAALHASRRGQRKNDPGMTAHQLGGLLADVAGLVRTQPEPGSVSFRALAAHCKVSDRTVRRWIGGTDWPNAAMTRRLETWIARARKADRPAAENL